MPLRCCTNTLPASPHNSDHPIEAPLLVGMPNPLSIMRSPDLNTPRGGPVKNKAKPPLTPSRYAAYEGEDYEIESVLGRGAFGMVTLCRSVHDDSLVAMKTIDRFRLHTDLLRKAVMREIHVLKSVIPPHAGIVPLLKVIETPRSIHLVCAYESGGTLQDRVSEEGALAEVEVVPIARQLTAAVEHLHAHRVCHRDLKLDNCVLDEARQVVRLIDFGLSTVWKAADGGRSGDSSNAQPPPLLTKVAGSLAYMAPEMIQRKGYQGSQVDMWSLGCVIAALLGGELPFQSRNEAMMRGRIAEGSFVIPTWKSLSEEAKGFVSGLLVVAPDDRMTAEGARRRAWLAA